MTRIKIDAPKRYLCNGSLYANKNNAPGKSIAVRVPIDADWRKLMRLVRAIEKTEWLDVDTLIALDALRVWK